MGGIFLRRFGHQTETWTTVFAPGIISSSTGWAGFTMRQRLPASVLTDLNCSQFRALLRTTGSVGINVSKMYVQLAGAGAYDFASAPIQVFFGGSASGSAAAGGNDLTCDGVPFPFTGTADLMTSIFFAASPATSVTTYGSTTPGTNGFKSGDDAITTLGTGYSNSAFAYAFRLVQGLTP